MDILEILNHLIQNEIEYCMEVNKDNGCSSTFAFSSFFSFSFLNNGSLFQVIPASSYDSNITKDNSCQQKFEVVTTLYLFPVYHTIILICKNYKTHPYNLDRGSINFS